MSNVCPNKIGKEYHTSECKTCSSQGFNEVIETNALGGKNSSVNVRYDLIPPKVLKLLAQVLEEGSKKYAPDNWKLVPSNDHDNHAMRHRIEYLLEPSMEHLSHYLTRVVMFISQELDK